MYYTNDCWFIEKIFQNVEVPVRGKSSSERQLLFIFTCLSSVDLTLLLQLVSFVNSLVYVFPTNFAPGQHNTLLTHQK